MGTCNISTQNGGGLQAQAIFDDMVLYPSPYMVVTPRGYTNHYYAGSERIASRIGDRCWTITATDEWEKPSPEEEALQNFWNIGKEEYPFGEKSDYNSPTTNTTPINGYEERVQYDCTPVELPRVDILHSTDMLGYTINCDYSYQNDAPVYYYHPDHLGSTSWVTNFKGNEHQFIAYLPYGEPLLNVLYDNYDSRYGLIKDARYKFTGKERDWETGYDYVEQRYYWWPGGFWLRPDPLLDKYIHLSPYVYCNGNPMKYVDPDGKWSIIVTASKNRGKNPYALFNVYDNKNNLIYRTIVKVVGQHRNRTKTNGDTPIGKYKILEWRKTGNDRYDAQKYGPNDLLALEYLGEEGKGRNGMHVHGGRNQEDLSNTQGCIRISDDDIAELKQLTDMLETMDPTEYGTTLDVQNDLSGSLQYSTDREEYKYNILKDGYLLPEIIITPTCE